MQQLLTRVDVAERLRVCVRTVDRLITEDWLPAFMVGRQVMTNSSDLEQWIATRPRRQRWREPGAVVILPDNHRGGAFEFYDAVDPSMS
jgi:excisionase family DNA binding protein